MNLESLNCKELQHEYELTELKLHIFIGLLNRESFLFKNITNKTLEKK